MLIAQERHFQIKIWTKDEESVSYHPSTSSKRNGKKTQKKHNIQGLYDLANSSLTNEASFNWDEIGITLLTNIKKTNIFILENPSHHIFISIGHIVCEQELAIDKI